MIAQRRRTADETVDLLVVGGGLAGATTALVAAELGLDSLLIEKQASLGGSTPYSAGNLLQLDGAEALDHLRSLSFGRTPDEVLRSYQSGLHGLRRWLELRGAQTSDVNPALLPNCWPNLPGAHGVGYYTVDGPGGAGAALFQTISDSLLGSDVDVRTLTSLSGLLTEHGRVTGADVIAADGSIHRILARRGVVLTTGGFENDTDLCETYLPVPSVRAVGNPGNTGDGLRAAQSAGAALWHMSTFYGFWAFAAPGFATAFPLLFLGPGHLLVDPDGRRFAAETGREAHDVMRSVGDFLPGRLNRPGLPVHAIFDRTLLEFGPLARFPSPSGYRWSADNRTEADAGWIRSASSPSDLARQIGLDSAVLTSTLELFNRDAAAGIDPEFGRSAESMSPVDTSQLYAIEVWPGVATTSGGPRRDGRGRVLAEGGHPISGLYAAGGNGGIWGHLTEHGGGLTDALVFGSIVAHEAAGLPGILSV